MPHSPLAPRLADVRGLPVLALVAVVALAGCTAAGPEPVPTVTAVAQEPRAATSVLGSADPAELAVQASRAFFERAPVAVVVPAGDAASELSGASIAVALGVPVLLAGGAETAELLDEELARLGTQTVVGVGDVAALLPGAEQNGPDDSAEGEPAGGGQATAPQARGGPVRASVRLVADGSETAGGRTDVVRAADAGREVGVDRESPVPVELVQLPADAASIAAVFGLELVDSDPVVEGGQVAALASLDPASPTVLRLEGAPAPEPEPTATTTPGNQPVLPVLAETTRVSGVVVLSDGSALQAAAVGTVRAAGADVLSVPGGDPRASSETIAGLALAKPTAVVGLGAGFGSPETLAWRVATAATGVELPGGTQLVFAGKRLAALYGTPGSGALGVLGEQGIPETIARARQHAEALQPYTQDTMVPSLEIIASIASAGAGPDGDYSAARPVSELRPLVDAASEAGVFVVLDLQPGRSDFLTQAKMYEELLLLPHVGLALDPEWRLAPDQVHLRQIGRVGIDEVNQVVDYVAGLTRENHLPQKLFVVHQFRLSMVQDRDRLDTSRSELAMMIHVDGQGSQPAKNTTWNVLRANAPQVYWGWKNFYDEDVPMLNPEQTMRLDPVPHLISYQ